MHDILVHFFLASMGVVRSDFITDGFDQNNLNTIFTRRYLDFQRVKR